jgi:thioredoxin reductase (NADPH)
MGRGVSTCAVCDAPFYKGKITYVVGGGDAAMEEALALVKFAKSVSIVHRRNTFKASKIMQDRILKDNKDKVSVLWDSQLTEIKGKDKVESIVVKNSKNGETKNIPAEGVFIAIGHKPATEIFTQSVGLNDKGYVLTRLGFEQKSVALAGNNLDQQGLVKYPTMTTVEGVFAAGDVVDFKYRQAVTAAGFGTMAALDVEKWLETEMGVEVGGTAQY